MKNILVIGASGGIGRALVAVANGRYDGAHIIRAQRLPEAGVVPMDLEDPDSIATAAQKVSDDVSHLDCIINAVGLLHDDFTAPEKSVRAMNAQKLQRYFAINATGMALIGQNFWRLLAKAPGPSVFASLAARVGSIGDNRLGGWYGYRASKAAQVMLNRTLAIEMRRRAPQLICVCLHPGTVDTALSKPFQQNVPAAQLFSPELCANHLLDVVDALKPEDSGKHIAWDGRPIPW